MVKALAEYMIEHYFGVKSAHTVWQEHRYELQGFTDLFGQELIARIKAGEEVTPDKFPSLPPLSVRLAFTGKFDSLENMAVEIVDCAEGKVNLALEAANGLASVMLTLDFANERLDFEVFHHLATADNGSPAGAHAELDRLRFVDFYCLNGKLEIWAGSCRLSRKDAYIPVNVDLGATHEKYQEMIALAEAVLKRRGGQGTAGE